MINHLRYEAGQFSKVLCMFVWIEFKNPENRLVVNPLLKKFLPVRLRVPFYKIL